MRIKLRSFFWKLSDYVSSLTQPPAPINIVAARDGHLYEIRENDFMRMIVKKNNVQELDEVSEGVFFKGPKIPGSFLATTIAFFKYYGSKQLEVAVHIYWDRTNHSYELVCPEQTVSFDEVTTYSDPVFNGLKEFVVSIHSHHEMPAVFSPGDNRNDVGFKVYGIIGRINRSPVEYQFRARFNDSEFKVDVMDLFDMDGVKSTEVFPECWKARVKSEPNNI